MTYLLTEGLFNRSVQKCGEYAARDGSIYVIVSEHYGYSLLEEADDANIDFSNCKRTYSELEMFKFDPKSKMYTSMDAPDGITCSRAHFLNGDLFVYGYNVRCSFKSRSKFRCQIVINNVGFFKRKMIQDPLSKEECIHKIGKMFNSMIRGVKIEII